MIGASMIPASFLTRARGHLRRTGQPFVYGPRRRTDTGLFAERNPVSERWCLMVNPTTVPILIEQVMESFASREQGPRTRMLVKLAQYAAVAVGDLPRAFVCEDVTVGRVEVCDGVPFVSCALAVSCLSYVLRHRKPRSGVYIEEPL